MGKPSDIRHKARKKALAASKINYDNAKPNQLAALDAERDKLIANAMKRLPASKRSLLTKDGGRTK